MKFILSTFTFEAHAYVVIKLTDFVTPKKHIETAEVVKIDSYVYSLVL